MRISLWPAVEGPRGAPVPSLASA